MTPERMKMYLLDYARYLKSDECKSDDFHSEGMTFAEVIELMDEVSKAVEKHALELK